MRHPDLFLRAATQADADPVATLIRTARHTAMPWLREPGSAEDQADWVRFVLIPSGTVVIAARPDASADPDVPATVVGVSSVHDGWLDQLYVAPEVQGAGVGTVLLDDAKRRSPAGLHLWVFQRNDRARRFYEERGCRPVRFTDGRENMEREPDVLYRWEP